MASGALPPGFPAVEIDGEHYWDGGLVSNTPLQWVIESNPAARIRSHFRLISGAQGSLPRNLAEVAHVTKKFSFQAARARAPANSRTCIGFSVPLTPCCAGFPPILRRTMI